MISGRTLSVKGKTEPGARVSLNGQQFAVQPDGTFNELVSVRESGPQVVVRATGRDGGVTEKVVISD